MHQNEPDGTTDEDMTRRPDDEKLNTMDIHAIAETLYENSAHLQQLRDALVGRYLLVIGGLGAASTIISQSDAVLA